MKYKRYIKEVFLFNFYHYSSSASSLFCKRLDLENQPIDYTTILQLGDVLFGRKKAILLNFFLFPLFFLLSFALDYFLPSFPVLLASFLQLFFFFLCLRKFMCLPYKKKENFLLFLFVFATLAFQFYWSISVIFMTLYDNLLAFHY